MIVVDAVVCGEYPADYAKEFALAILSAVELTEKEAHERDSR